MPILFFYSCPKALVSKKNEQHTIKSDRVIASGMYLSFMSDWSGCRRRKV